MKCVNFLLKINYSHQVNQDPNLETLAEGYELRGVFLDIDKVEYYSSYPNVSFCGYLI